MFPRMRRRHMTRSPDPNPTARFRVRRRRFLGRYRYVRLRWRLLFAAIDLIGWVIFGPGRCVARSLGRQQGWLRQRNPPGDTRPLADLGAVNRREALAPGKILLVQLDHLGDAILSTGLVNALANRFPSAQIDVLAAPWNAAVFRLTRRVHRVRVLDQNRFGKVRNWRWVTALVRCGWRLRRQRYDIALDVRGEFPHALLMWLAGATHRIGWNCGGGGFLLTESVAYERGRHEVLSRLALLQKLVPDAEEDEVAPCVSPPRRALEVMSGRLQALGLIEPNASWDSHSLPLPESSTRPLVVLHVGAGTIAKRWPSWHWRDLLGRLIVLHNAAVVLVGAAADGPIAQQLLGGGELQGVMDWTGQLNLAELAALLHCGDLLIGGDSGPAHLAAALGRPVVAIFSGTNDARQWHPWGSRVAVVHHQPPCAPCHRKACPLADHPCLADILPEHVAFAASRWLPSGLNPEPWISRIENSSPAVIAARTAMNPKSTVVSASEGVPLVGAGSPCRSDNAWQQSNEVVSLAGQCNGDQRQSLISSPQNSSRSDGDLMARQLHFESRACQPMGPLEAPTR